MYILHRANVATRELLIARQMFEGTTKYCARTVVCSAFCERSYEGIGFNRDVIVRRLKPRQMFEGTTKNAHMQVF